MSKTLNVSSDAQRWLAIGERGISSDTIFSHLTGFDVMRGWRMDTPFDPVDLRRCRLLLQAVPEFKERFGEMRTLSGKWETLVDHWDELCGLFDEEAPNWASQDNWVAQRTYKRMKELGL